MLTDPEYKAFLRSSRGGGSGAVGGGSSFAPLGGGGGGGLAGSLNMTAGGGGDALRTLLRRRMRPPGSTAGPSYLGGQTPQGGAIGALLGGGKVSGGLDTSGLSKTPTMTSYGRMPAPGGGGGGGTGGTGGGGFSGPPHGGTGGGVSGPDTTWNPNDPNSAPSTPWANGDNGFLQNLITILGRFNATGAFTPNGSSAVSDMTRSNAVSNAQAMLDRNKLTAQSLGTDPATAASYALQSGLRGQSDVSNAVTQSALQQLLGQQKFGQGLLTNYLSGVFGNKLQQQNNGTDWGAILQGIGSIIPG